MTATSSPKPTSARRADGARAALWCAAVAGLFCLLIAAGLTATMVQDKLSNPLNDRRMLELKAQLARRPKDEALKETIRDWDQKLRGDFFRRRAAMTHGAWLLLGGAAVLVLSAKAARVLGKTWPAPGDIAARDAESARSGARWSVAAAGLGMVALLFLAALWGGDALRGVPVPAVTAGRPPLAPPVWPGPEELAKNVPVFRGWGGTGIISPAEGWPDKWDGPSGEGILWKTPIPLPGFSSPVVWGNRIFLTGADEEAREVYCLDADSGRILWKQKVEGPGGELPNNEQTGLAAPTAATDGENIYVIFGTGDVAGFDFSGRKLWSRNLGIPESSYGYSASLTVFQNNVIIQWDVGEDPEKSRSMLLAVNGRTGKTVWQTRRPVMNGWSSPVVARVGDAWQILACGAPWVIGYDAATGAELWRAKLLDGSDVAPSPVCLDNVVYLANDRAVMAALKPGAGDITESGILWKKDDVDLPDLVSPACNGELLWTINANGLLQCFEAKTGKKVWEHEYKLAFQASPVLVGDRLWLLDGQGLMRFVKAGRTFEELGTCQLGETAGSTPALVGGRVYIRGKRHLYCIGKK